MVFGCGVCCRVNDLLLSIERPAVGEEGETVLSARGCGRCVGGNDGALAARPRRRVRRGALPVAGALGARRRRAERVASARARVSPVARRRSAAAAAPTAVNGAAPYSPRRP